MLVPEALDTRQSLGDLSIGLGGLSCDKGTKGIILELTAGSGAPALQARVSYWSSWDVLACVVASLECVSSRVGIVVVVRSRVRSTCKHVGDGSDTWDGSTLS